MTILASTSIRDISEKLRLDHKAAAVMLYVYGRTLVAIASLLTTDARQIALAGRYAVFRSGAAKGVGDALGLGAETVRLILNKLEDSGLIDRDGLLLRSGSPLFAGTGRGPFGAAVGPMVDRALSGCGNAWSEGPTGVTEFDALLELLHELAFTRMAVVALGCAAREAGTVTRALYLLALVELAQRPPLEWQHGVPTAELGMLVGSSRGSALAALQALQALDLVVSETPRYAARWRVSASGRIESLRRSIGALTAGERPQLPPSMSLKPRLRKSA